jgi:hypothetical protein
MPKRPLAISTKESLFRTVEIIAGTCCELFGFLIAVTGIPFVLCVLVLIFNGLEEYMTAPVGLKHAPKEGLAQIADRVLVWVAPACGVTSCLAFACVKLEEWAATKAKVLRQAR